MKHQGIINPNPILIFFLFFGHAIATTFGWKEACGTCHVNDGKEP